MCSTLVSRLSFFSFVSICKYLLTAGLREQVFNVTQSWPSILKFSPSGTQRLSSAPQNLTSNS